MSCQVANLQAANSKFQHNISSGTPVPGSSFFGSKSPQLWPRNSTVWKGHGNPASCILRHSRLWFTATRCTSSVAGMDTIHCRRGWWTPGVWATVEAVALSWMRWTEVEDIPEFLWAWCMLVLTCYVNCLTCYVSSNRYVQMWRHKDTTATNRDHRHRNTASKRGGGSWRS